MPKPKQNRIIVLQSSYSPTNKIAALNLNMLASFDSASSVGAVNLFQDLSVTGNESSKYRMNFTVGATVMGELSLYLQARGENLASGVSMGKTGTSSSADPVATVTPVTLVSAPTAHFTRNWQQNALNAGTTLVKQVAYLDIRARASSGYGVTQVVTSAAVNALVISYAWGAIGSSPLVTGTVRLDASATATGIYSLGAATVVDDV